MGSSHLPRFKRSLTVAPIKITARDREIIQLVHRHRFLRSLQIVALMQQSPQHVLRRLQLLYHHGYLERPRAQLDYYHQGGSRPIVYGLGKKGAALLKQELGDAFRDVRWGEKNRSVGRIFLEHALLVSEVMVAVELACREHGGIRFISKEELLIPGEASRPLRWRVNVNSQLKLGVVPDGVFALEFTGPAGKPDRAFFFLEADRGTMPVVRRSLSQTSFHRKLLAYEATWSQSIHQTRFGFNRFRVLTVTKSAVRLKALVEACSRLKSGRGLFLFAEQISLRNPSTLLSPVWRATTQTEPVSLLPESLLPDAASLAV